MSVPPGEAALLAGVEAALAAPGDPPARLLAVCHLLADGVPIFAAGRFVAQLDIDSHEGDPFRAADRRLLEAVCARVAPAVEALREGPWLDAPQGGR